MQSGPGYATRMFRTLYEMRINIELMATSEMCITCLIEESLVPAAVRVLHKALQLEEA
jgi:aspartate kinase